MKILIARIRQWWHCLINPPNSSEYHVMIDEYIKYKDYKKKIIKISCSCGEIFYVE